MSDFISRTVVKNELPALPEGANMSSRPKHSATALPFDITEYRGKERPGQHPPAASPTHEVTDPVFTSHMTTARPSPKAFLTKGSGFGGTLKPEVIKAVSERRATGPAASPPKAGAYAARPNPPNTELRRYYERSDLPIIIIQGARPKLNWKVDILRLDFHHYLPLFVGGLRETEEPYRFIAEEGTRELLSTGGEAKVLPVLPQLIIPLKEGLNTRDPEVMKRCLRTVQVLARLGSTIGQALVPYYRQLVPVMALYVNRIASTGDKVDYHQRFGRIGEMCQETLNILETHGGPDAFINIRYLVPTYESCVLN